MFVPVNAVITLPEYVSRPRLYVIDPDTVRFVEETTKEEILAPSSDVAGLHILIECADILDAYEYVLVPAIPYTLYVIFGPSHESITPDTLSVSVILYLHNT